MINKVDRKAERARRHARVRAKVSGTAECPRLAVTKSNKNIIAQIIDDTKAETLVYVSTLDSDIKTKRANKEAAKEVGAAIAKKALEKNIKAKERYGREKYLMKAANEDIYVIKQQENTLSQTE